MTVLRNSPESVPAVAGVLAGVVPTDDEAPGLHVTGRPDALAGTGEEQPFDRLARLAAMVLGTPSASVTIGTDHAGSSLLGSRNLAYLRHQTDHSLRQHVLDSGTRLLIGDTRLDGRGTAAHKTGPPPNVIAWAGFPVRDPAGQVVGTLCVADHLPRHWTTTDVELLQALADLAGREAALQVALERGAERAALVRTLQESLLPPRLPGIPGLQVAARYVAGGRGAEVLGDFYDVFPSVRGSWGVVVGDVCGKGAAAAKSTALARYTLRGEAHRASRPSLILAALNRALLDWPTDDPRFLTAIYATVRPTAAGATVQISSGGHPLALVHRADGRVQAFGRPGTLLGLFPDPELHDSQGHLRAGDSLILFTDGVTEARSHPGRDLYGDGRLRDLVAGLGDASAGQTANAIQQAALAFSGSGATDDTVSLVLKVPRIGMNGHRPLLASGLPSEVRLAA